AFGFGSTQPKAVEDNGAGTEATTPDSTPPAPVDLGQSAVLINADGTTTFTSLPTVTEAQVTSIKFIIDNLAKGLAAATWNSQDLSKAEKTVNNLHPLSFLRVILEQKDGAKTLA